MKRILFLDDESALCDLFGDLLEGENREIFCFTEGAEALLEAQRTNFDICFVDYHMPMMNGAKILDELIRAQPTTTKYVVLSGDTELRDFLTEDSQIAVKVMYKPYDFDAIEAFIDSD